MTRTLSTIALSVLLSGCKGCEPGDTSDSGDSDTRPSETDSPVDSPWDSKDSIDDTQHSKPPPHTGETGEDTGETGDPMTGDFWEDFAWTGLSDFDIVLDMASAPTYDHMEVRMCTSTEWWGIDCWDYTTIAHSISSLDLLVTSEGIIVTGMPDYWDLSQMGTWLDPLAIHAISSPDLEHWGSHVWPVNDSSNFMNIDPALSLDQAGNPRAVYFGLPEEYHGDPADYPGTHAIDLASWTAEHGFTEQPDPIYEDDTLVDPDLRSYDGVEHLFATFNGSIMHATGDEYGVFTYDNDFVFGEAQVPHANSDDGVFMVAGQGGGGWPPPRYMIMNEDGSWPGESEQLYSDHENVYFFDGSCTSPVLGYYDGLYVTICSVAAYM